jgi:two-component system copper resistance phosphate regulon response regulator CusR
MRILLIEDEPEIAAVVKRGLEEARYMVDVAEDGAAGLDRALKGDYSLIILDLMLPGTDGWQICQRLRARRNPIPILMVTARDAVDDRVRGLEMGADDYLPKPFAFRELKARVQALLRRDKIHKGKTFRIADLEIDTERHRVTRAGQEIPLTQREYLLLEALATREGQVLTRDMIQQRVWWDDDSYSNTVDVHISSLRKKIDVDHEIKLIHTVHGRGYTLRGPHSEIE